MFDAQFAVTPGACRNARFAAEVLCSAAEYEAIYVRRLRHVLDGKQTAAVQQVAQRACKAGAASAVGSHASDEEIVVLMALASSGFLAPRAARGLLARLSCAPRVERFLTSRLVGDMLVAVGHAQDDGHRFVATTADERVLLPIQELAAAEHARGRLSSRRGFRSTRSISARSMSTAGARELPVAT